MNTTYRLNGADGRTGYAIADDLTAALNARGQHGFPSGHKVDVYKELRPNAWVPMGVHVIPKEA